MAVGRLKSPYAHRSTAALPNQLEHSALEVATVQRQLLNTSLRINCSRMDLRSSSSLSSPFLLHPVHIFPNSHFYKLVSVPLAWTNPTTPTQQNPSRFLSAPDSRECLQELQQVRSAPKCSAASLFFLERVLQSAHDALRRSRALPLLWRLWSGP